MSMHRAAQRSFAMARWLLWVGAFVLVPSAWAGERVLPAEFVHDRVYVVPRLPDGTPLRFYTDSGGGWNMLPAEVAERIGLQRGPVVQGDDGLQETVEFPVFAAAAAIPPPVADRWLDNRLAVAAGQESTDGFLGNRWFAARIWEFDYAARTLTLLEPGDIPQDMDRVPMTMRDGDNMYWPRIVIEVDGEPIPMLLDTGATATLSAGGAEAYGLPVGTEVATSFITRSHFERWRQRHPDWQVATDGDRLGNGVLPMIRVPEVGIAGHRVGPVWFAVRPDRNFTEFMSGMTDAPVEGAIGGSALRHFRVVLDYPGQAAYFTPSDGVSPAP